MGAFQGMQAADERLHTLLNKDEALEAFQSALVKIAGTDESITRQEMRTLFDQLDENHDNFLSKQEFRALFARLEFFGQPPNFDVVFADTDLNNDGKISFDEFILVACRYLKM
eukprot:NODE_1501_length_588_cov_620.536178_g1203_i0.p1 GENE.NODE_1501_length_588_cov_620.536178_g1203_i0~~NODE_1501_length_588_cov_620.536178_g1203_i0.p1  ORF type:complete len:122 (-),score=39.00 NODE_1501_length_588_cov_620.536178_g1203_i0:221-559(-)